MSLTQLKRRGFITLLGGAVAYCAKQASDAGDDRVWDQSASFGRSLR
jgi:hypothetical protein